MAPWWTGVWGQACLLAHPQLGATLLHSDVIPLATSWGLHGNPPKVTAPWGTIWLAGGLCCAPPATPAPHSLPACPLASVGWDPSGLLCPMGQRA